ncbi:MAG: hypothetical protein WAS21_22715 [Geminicoccaceae bacterium]
MPVIDAEAKYFTLLNSEKDGSKIGLKQVDPNSAAPSPDLIVSVPADQTGVMVGLVDAKANAGLVEPSRHLQWDPKDPGSMLTVGSWFLAIALVLIAGLAVVRKIWNNEIDLKTVISESDGKASLARFQALLFTFIFLIAFVMIVANSGEFPKEIPGGVLAILAGSAGTYLLAKYIGNDSAAPTLAGATPRILWGADTSKLALNTDIAVARVRVPYGGTTLSAEPRDFKVVAVAVDAIKIRLNVIVVGDAKAGVHVRVGGAPSVKIDGAMEITGASGKLTEIAVAAFGGTASDVIDLEISKV